ncbi:hypothetical protein BC936DRAFT_145203 [Jimgerdemannia flammicorona]|uniref:Uncharacterized protein n=1 Tax=Jimgerdemannia flammicorona TaxID=994334 RepID=A0A433DAM7_9FUNG|nr:hypothetical protein BC936DRAFT_145203 [Jimgerdemannia flammicorona]
MPCLSTCIIYKCCKWNSIFNFRDWELIFFLIYEHVNTKPPKHVSSLFPKQQLNNSTSPHFASRVVDLNDLIKVCKRQPPVVKRGFQIRFSLNTLNSKQIRSPLYVDPNDLDAVYQTLQASATGYLSKRGFQLRFRSKRPRRCLSNLATGYLSKRGFQFGPVLQVSARLTKGGFQLRLR